MSANSYNTEEELDAGKLKYYFESTGQTTLVKAIEYSPILQIRGRQVYNLGFGDYDENTNTFSDDSISNNGDAYKVFNTVLDTIPAFFSKNPNGIIFVQGSDSGDDYFNKCHPTCRKKCTDVCKNAGRRISTYRWYVDKHYEELVKDYSFLGGFIDKTNNQTTTEVYKKGVGYDVILVYK